MGRRMRRQSFASSTCVLIVVASSSLGQAFVFSSRLSPIKNFFRTPRCDGSTRANQKRAASPDEDLDGARDPAPLREMEAPPVVSILVFSIPLSCEAVGGLLWRCEFDFVSNFSTSVSTSRRPFQTFENVDWNANVLKKNIVGCWTEQYCRTP